MLHTTRKGISTRRALIVGALCTTRKGASPRGVLARGPTSDEREQEQIGTKLENTDSEEGKGILDFFKVKEGQGMKHAT